MTTPYNNYSDEDLLHEVAAKGDQMAFQVLFDRYKHLVLGVCLKYLEHETMAKNAVQQIFLKIWADSRRFQTKRFKPWLYSVTKDYCLMELRKNNPNISPDENLNAEKTEWVDALQLTIKQKQLLAHIEACLEHLNPDQSSCIRKFYVEGLSYAATALAMGLDLKTAKTHIQKGGRNLRDCVERKMRTAGYE